MFLYCVSGFMLCLVVLAYKVLWRLPEGRSSNSLCSGCDGSAVTFPDSGYVEVMNGGRTGTDVQSWLFLVVCSVQRTHWMMGFIHTLYFYFTLLLFFRQRLFPLYIYQRAVVTNYFMNLDITYKTSVYHTVKYDYLSLLLSSAATMKCCQMA